MADGWPMDSAEHSRNKRKRRANLSRADDSHPGDEPDAPIAELAPKVSKGKGAPRSRKGGGARKDKAPSKKAAAAVQHSPFKSDEFTPVRPADTMGYSLERAIANARALELKLTSYELCQEDLLSVSLEAGRTDMLTWQQAEVIIQALEAGVITLARRPLADTEVEHPPRHVRTLNPSSGSELQPIMGKP